MYPQSSSIDQGASSAPASAGSSRDVVVGASQDEGGGVDNSSHAIAWMGAGGVPGAASLSSFQVLGGEEGAGGGEGEARRQAGVVAEGRAGRLKDEKEAVRKGEEEARLVGETTRREELLRVRKACLPGVVFLAHEVSFFMGEGLATKILKTWEFGRLTRPLFKPVYRDTEGGGRLETTFVDTRLCTMPTMYSQNLVLSTLKRGQASEKCTTV